MKKTIIAVAVLTLVLLLGACSSARLTADEAKAIALGEVGVSAEAVRGLTSHLERDDGASYYEVEFYVDATEYDIDVDVQTGEILHYDRDGKTAAGHETTSPTTTLPSVTTTTQTVALLTEEQAKQIALDHAAVSVDEAQHLTAHLDRDDGRSHYDVEFVKDGTEYEYEIDAETGAVLSYDTDLVMFD